MLGSSRSSLVDGAKKKHGLKGWRFIRDAGWWRGPPSERAARMNRSLVDVSTNDGENTAFLQIKRIPSPSLVIN